MKPLFQVQIAVFASEQEGFRVVVTPEADATPTPTITKTEKATSANTSAFTDIQPTMAAITKGFVQLTVRDGHGAAVELLKKLGIRNVPAIGADQYETAAQALSEALNGTR
jgi:hypothetical protein